MTAKIQTSKPNRSRLPKFLIPEGKEISDRKTWIIGQYIASGGYGAVYCAADIQNPKDFDYVIKIEPKESGALYSEIHHYRRFTEASKLADWENKRKSHIGISKLYDFGFFEHGNSTYRFMVLDRYSMDLTELLEKTGGVFPLKTVCHIGLSIIDTLEYIHFHEFVHRDIKGCNLLLGRKKGTENKIYIVDMGLVTNYVQYNGDHVENLSDDNLGHVGTSIFMSRDAHRGCFSRRSDLETVVFNLLKWLTGSLPWSHLTDYKQLHKAKERCMENMDEFQKVLFHGKPCPDGIFKLLHYIKELQFEDEPDYNKCRKFLEDDLKSAEFHVNDLIFGIKKTEKGSCVSEKPEIVRKNDTSSKSVEKVSENSSFLLESGKMKEFFFGVLSRGISWCTQFMVSFPFSYNGNILYDIYILLRKCKVFFEQHLIHQRRK